MSVYRRQSEPSATVEKEFTRQSAEPVHLTSIRTAPSLGYVNALRVLSVLAVIAIHISSPLVENIRDVHSIDWWIAHVYNSVLRWAVPIFVLISGSLLLDDSKEEQIGTFFRKRSDRVLIPLVAWSLFYSLVNIYKFHMSTKLVLYKIFYGVPSVHLWYLYMLLGLYLITPALRKYVKNTTESDRLYFLVVTFSIACVFCLYFHVHARQVNVAFLKFLPYTAYFVCGYHLRKMDMSRVSFKVLLSVFFLSTLALIGGTALLVAYTKADFVWELIYNHFSPPIIIMSICVFMVFLKFDSMNITDNSLPYRLFAKIAPYSFGIYLVHLLVITAIGKTTGIWSCYKTPLLGIPLTAVLTFCVSCAIVYIIAQIPYVRKIVI